MDALYDRIGINYQALRQPDPRIQRLIDEALGEARSVINVGAGTGSYEPAGRSVVAVEPSAAMIAKRPANAAPAVQASATLLGSTGGTTYTRERPGHGRSGGALIDPVAGVLVGVVQGYEVDGRRRGMYVSHLAILQFLSRNRPGTPAVREEREFILPRRLAPNTPCPDGRSPLLPR